jgi:uncharacterized protein YqgC (DUF456 family)
MSRPDQTFEALILIGAVIILLSTAAGYIWGVTVNTGQGASDIPGSGAILGSFIGIIITLSLVGVAIASRRKT